MRLTSGTTYFVAAVIAVMYRLLENNEVERMCAEHHMSICCTWRNFESATLWNFEIFGGELLYGENFANLIRIHGRNREKMSDYIGFAYKMQIFTNYVLAIAMVGVTFCRVRSKLGKFAILRRI